MDFAGGEIIATQAGSVVTANITPDLDTGIGKWSPEFFQQKIYEYRDYAEHGSPPMAGPESFTLMPWLAFSELTREDLGAIYVFLRFGQTRASLGRNASPRSRVVTGSAGPQPMTN
jgi:hypothetical protein